mmetsp:Transcript_29869/g.99054  ORF Transcript_29869/g.99054 Transcript_29869/m.99054 type:complete len:232 (+) Transcript_29869:356-1051(+)
MVRAISELEISSAATRVSACFSLLSARSARSSAFDFSLTVDVDSVSSARLAVACALARAFSAWSCSFARLNSAFSLATSLSRVFLSTGGLLANTGAADGGREADLERATVPVAAAAGRRFVSSSTRRRDSAASVSAVTARASISCSRFARSSASLRVRARLSSAADSFAAASAAAAAAAVSAAATTSASRRRKFDAARSFSRSSSASASSSCSRTYEAEPRSSSSSLTCAS